MSDNLQSELEVMRRMSDQRLDRIEGKIDTLSDAMVSLARAEEKLLSMEKNAETFYDRLNRHSEKIDEVESRVDEHTSTLSLLTKGLWILFGTAASVIVAELIRHT